MQALRILFSLILISAAIPVSAQTVPQPTLVPATVVVHVTNHANGTPVPGMNVYLVRSRGRGDTASDFEYGETDTSGTATITGELAAGPWMLEIFNGGALFEKLTTTLFVTPGKTYYEVAYPLVPSRTSHPPVNLDQPRTLSIRVLGRMPNGQIVPVHYATIYNIKGTKVIMTGYDGTAVVSSNVPLGEYAQLTAEAVNWEPSTEAFIAGASQSGSRLTRADDYITFTLNAKNGEVGEHAVEVRVRGRKNGALVPVHYATIYDANGKKILMTGYDGTGQGMVPDVPPGESYRLTAEANHWKNATQSVTAAGASNASLNQPFRAALGSGTYRDIADFILEPEQAAQTNMLTVEVLSHADDKPIAGASVTLYKGSGFPGKAIARGTTSAQGEISFDSETMTDARSSGEAKVGATHGGFSSNTQSVSSEELGAGEHRFVLYLRPKRGGPNEYDTSGQWEFTWTWSVTSVDFVGTVSGGPKSFTFSGTVAGGGNAIWTAKEGTASCNINAQNPKHATMTCTASFPPGGTNDKGSSWTGQTTNGTLSRYFYGKATHFQYTGRNGHGQASGSPPADIDLFQLVPRNGA